MQSPEAFPISLELTEDDEVLTIGWEDGRTGGVRLDALRAACPCAVCCGHHPSQSLNLKPESFAGVRLHEIAPVGRYAYNVVFSDSHSTGIYTLEQLRRLTCP